MEDDLNGRGMELSWGRIAYCISLSVVCSKRLTMTSPMSIADSVASPVKPRNTRSFDSKWISTGSLIGPWGSGVFIASTRRTSLIAESKWRLVRNFWILNVLMLPRLTPVSRYPDLPYTRVPVRPVLTDSSPPLSPLQRRPSLSPKKNKRLEEWFDC